MTVLIYLFVCLVFGSSWIAIKLGLQDVPPLWSSTLRFIVSVIILAGIWVARRYAAPESLRRTVRLAIPGFFMYGLHYALIYFAQLHINSALTSVLFASFPMFVALLSTVMLRDERPRGLAWLGLILGLAGIILISYDSLRISDNLFLGTVLALAGTLAAAFGMVLHRKYHTSENIVVAATLQMTLGGIPLALAAMTFESWSSVTITTLSAGSILFLSVFATVLVFLAYYWLLRRIRAVTLSLMAFITPLIAIGIGVIFFDENLTTLMILGTAQILLGVYLVVRK